MPILNYTTTINADKSISEIQRLLGKAGASSVMVEYQHGEPNAIVFEVHAFSRRLRFLLPANWRGVQRRLTEDGVAKKYLTEAHARRVAWRIIKDWCEVQMALIDSGQAELAEVFLPYAINPNTGDTLYIEFQQAQGLLPAPKGE